MNTIKKKKTLYKVIIALACLNIPLQACAPIIKEKNSELELPKTYQGSPASQKNSTDISWKEFFNDPNLVKLIDFALENNRELKIVMQNISIANNEILARRGEYLPSVKAKSNTEFFLNNQEANKEEEKSSEEGEDSASSVLKPSLQNFGDPLHNLVFGIFASWEMDIWKRLRNAKDVAVLEYMATIEGKNFLITNLVAEVADSYYELIALDNQLANLEKNIRIQKDALEIVKQLKKAARANELAVKRFEAEVLKNQSNIYNLKQKIVETENKLNYLIGRVPQHINRSSENFDNLKPRLLANGVPSQLLQNRPDIRRAEKELEAAKLNIEVAKAKFYPSFGIKSGIGYQAFNPKYISSNQQPMVFSLSGEFEMPLINRYAIEAEYKSASDRQIQAVYEYEQTILNAYKEVANQMTNIENLEKNYQLKDMQVKMLTNSIDISNKLFQSARADYMEVLLTQRDALEARAELIETKKAQMTAMVSLYRALGGGWQKEDNK